jgi:HCOMODA/2-hydroxy-3-carboxy-muconic semialdehyde decarboxylase
MSALGAITEELVDANRILADNGIVDAFGHVSVRVSTNRFLLARNVAPGQVTAGDILEFNADSEPAGANESSMYLERYIHGELYRSRPDVGAVVHHHAFSSVAFGLVNGVGLRPVCHMAGFLGSYTPVFEIRTVAGDDSDLLIRNRELGLALAVTLGSASTVLMRGHGATVVGRDLRQAVYRAVYSEWNARLQLMSLSVGQPTYLTDGESQATAAALDRQIDRAWNIWRQAAYSTDPGADDSGRPAS